MPSSDSNLTIWSHRLLHLMVQIGQVDIIVEEHIVWGFDMIDLFSLVILEPNVIPPKFILLYLPLSSLSAA